MKKFFFIVLITFSVIFLKSCNSYPMDVTHKSDMNRNTEELQKRQEAEKNKIEPNQLNNFGKPDNR
jgi:PBP1b-binding outer membrane lipoprotein LpoB